MSKKTKSAKAAIGQALGGKKSSQKSGNEHITKITASSKTKSPEKSQSTDNVRHFTTNSKPTKKEKLAKKAQKPSKPAKITLKSDEDERPLSTYFVLARPFVAIGRYFRDSWRELRKVRWPNRKTSWKLTLAVLGYVALFMIFILVLDALFTFIFNLVIK